MGKKYLEEFCKRSSPDSWDIKPMPYNVFQTTVDDLHPFGNYYFDDKGGFPLAGKKTVCNNRELRLQVRVWKTGPI